ncbi:hypothetical protein ASF10_14165 [Flavobacterium sp. Leaf82]|uniref:hypothetical protein n=1 Tax=Flavobacterium sp. Leaf82 TaxID=1736238 RepID=UPI0006FF0A89|nr:hypothetical protein [Flavobacterium sp. Leaf82]KQO21260.1 hypothetical protein ASF10_14165 [Flavobacterium sp. Leaf82]
MESDERIERGKLTAEQAVKMLKEENVDITIDQARIILEFMRKLARITVSNFLNQQNETNSRPIRESEYRRTSRQRIFTKKPRRSTKKVLSDK